MKETNGVREGEEKPQHPTNTILELELEENQMRQKKEDSKIRE
jgi:hypothetical protein